MLFSGQLTPKINSEFFHVIFFVYCAGSHEGFFFNFRRALNRYNFVISYLKEVSER